MSVFHLYFAGMRESGPLWGGFASSSITHGNPWQCLRDLLENTKHTCIFVVTNDQWASWVMWKEKYKLEEFAWEMPYFVTNRNHPGYGRRLRAIVLKGKGTDES